MPVEVQTLRATLGRSRSGAASSLQTPAKEAAALQWKVARLSCLFVAALLASLSASASAQYNPAYCGQVAGTLNIHWELISGPQTPCTGIEYTNGTYLDASDGTVNMAGTSVSNNTCIGLDTYTLTVAPGGLTLTGTAHLFNVPMTLTRTPGDSCFVGDWVSHGYVFRAHIYAEPFLLAPTPAKPRSWGSIKSIYR